MDALPSPSPSIAVRARTRPTALVVAIALVTAASAGALLVPDRPTYSAIFPPVWFGFVGAAAGGVAIAARRRARRTAEAAAWIAAVLLLGASGGVVLDAMRGFFAVTGIPAGDFAVVDAPGFLARLTALVAAVAALRFARALHRVARPGRAGGAPSARIDDRASRIGAADGVAPAEGVVAAVPAHVVVPRRALLVIGLVLCVPYPLLKTVWWLGGEQSGFDVGFPAMEIAAFSIAAVGLIVLTTRAGARLPRRLVAAGGWIGSGVLLSMGALMVFGIVAQSLGLAAATVDLGGARATMVFAVYSTWFALGAVVAAATVVYEEASDAGVEPYRR